MNPLDYDAFSIAARLAAALDAAGVPYAIGGAIAYGLGGPARHVRRRHQPVRGPRRPGWSAGRARVGRRDVLVGWCDGLRVDLFTPSIPFSWEAGRTRVRVVGPHGPAWYLSAEATAVFKLLFFRGKDLVDLEKLVAVQGADLDRAYVRRWLVEMIGDDDERVRAWDRIVAEHG